MTAARAALEASVGAFAHHLAVVLVQLEMHAPDSPQVEAQLAWLEREAEAIGVQCAPEPFRLEVGGDQLVFGGEPLLRASLQAGRLLRLCRDRGIAALTFGEGLEAQELLRLLQWLTDERARASFAPGVLPTALASRGVKHAEVELSAGPLAPPPVEKARVRPAGPGAIRQYQAMADLLHDSHVAAYRGEGVEVDLAAGVVEQAISQMHQEPSGLLALAMYDDIDSFTVGHSVRVTLLALQVAQAAGASRQDLLRVGTAALLHDIGKSRIPQEILFKAGRLSAEERGIMTRHARLGGEILLEQGGVDPTAIGAAFCHHMGPNGHGYPTPALPFEPSGVSKLVRVCDVFEALTAVRPYKAALTPIHAYVIMHRMKDGFDARWLRFFIQCIGLYPIGTNLILDSGETGVVVAAGPTVHQPRVRLLGGGAGGPPLVTVGVPEQGVTRGIHAVLGGGTLVEIPAAVPGAVAGAEPAPACACEVAETGPPPRE